MTASRPLANAPPAALAALLVALAGCTAGTGGAEAGHDDDGPVLYLNVTAGGQTYRYSTDPLGGGDGSPSGSVSGSVTPGGNGSVQGNATSGSSTAQGNATAGNGTATATGTYGNASAGDGGGMPGVPSGPAPLDVRVELGAAGLEGELPFEWTFEWGEAAGTAGNGTSANATASPGAAPQQAREEGTSLPVTLRHTFTQAGQHTMAFGIQVAGQAQDAKDKVDGAGKAKDAVKTLRAAVHVQGQVPSGPEPGSFLGNQTDRFSGSSVAAAPPLCSALDTFEWRLNETFGGNASVVDRVLVTVESDGAGDVTLTLRDANGTELASGGGIDLEGPIPPGAYAIEVEACPSANLDYEVTAVGRHVAR